ncbi:MAG: UvrD-helicase domain-containing protein [Paramuribaculum sp.]|nr:UvrD-helicase domain-containing protein [Paramuribaculum sp.]
MLSIYKASAGSGKTFTLAYQYIKLLLARKDEKGRWHLDKGRRGRHRNILAVTFTNKATDEMKSRIIHELALLAGRVEGWTDDVPYRAMLISELGCSDSELRKAADAALHNLLFDFQFFQVSTIDSFFQTILRTFAREVDLPGDYEIDLNNEMTIRQAVNDMFASLAERSDSDTRLLISWITAYMRERIRAGESAAIFNRQSQGNSRIVGFFSSLLNESLADKLDDMRAYFVDMTRIRSFAAALNASEERILDGVKEAGRRVLDLVEARGYTAPNKLRLDSNAYKAFSRMAETGQSSSTIPPKVFAGDKSPYIGALAKYLEQDPDVELEGAVMEACRRDVESRPALEAIDLTRSNLFHLGLFGRMLTQIEDLRTDANAMLLSDTTSLLRGIISDEEAPFVYERVGVRIKHFLIDEFQDTSRMQWENLRPLLAEGISKGADSLIIGDVKQSIYRWRYSDPSLLNTEVAEAFASRSQTLGSEPGQNTNYRSSATVVNFNNELFQLMSSALGFDREYANVVQQIHRIDQPGYIDLLRLPKDLDSDERSEIALANMMQGIVRQIGSGRRPCDIAILTYTHSEGAEAIRYIMQHSAEHPELKGVTVISDDAMLLGESTVAKMIVNIMRFVYLAAETVADPESPKPRKSQRRLIRQLTYRYHHYLTSGGLSPEEALRQALHSASDPGLDYAELASTTSLDTFNLQSLIEQIIERYIIPFEEGHLAKEQNLYISAFVDAVADFCAVGTPDLRSFLQWWDTTGYRSEVSAPAQDNAIRVMTIHKSKGLEFPCVHIPFFRRPLVKFKNPEWFPTGGRFLDIDPAVVPPLIPVCPRLSMMGTIFEPRFKARVAEQEMESLNLAYVAFTRAGSELSVCFTEGADGTTEALLSATVDTMAWDAVEEDPDNDGIRRFVIGMPTEPGVRKVKAAKVTDPDDTMVMPAYTTESRAELWRDLKIERDLDFYDPRDHGTLLHSILQHIQHRRDLSKAIRRAVYLGRIPADEAPEAERLLASRLDAVADRHWFEGYDWVLNERRILHPDGEVSRPDRVVCLPDGSVAVIDYKFGDEHIKAHSRQVRSYMDMLAETGLKDIRGYIWYVVSGRIVEV